MCRTGPQGAPSPSRPAFSMGVRRRPAPRLQCRGRPARPRAAAFRCQPERRMCAEPRARRPQTSSLTSAQPHGDTTALLQLLPQLPGCHLTLRPPQFGRGLRRHGRSPDGGGTHTPPSGRGLRRHGRDQRERRWGGGGAVWPEGRGLPGEGAAGRGGC